MTRKTGLIAKLGLAATVTLGLAFATSPAASAAAPSFSVSPASGVSDGATATVTVTGALPNAVFGIATCANTASGAACDGGTATSFTTDASGSATIPLKLNRQFDGVGYDGTPVGPVDCAAASCFVGAGNNEQVLGEVAISFK
ncbi:enediyne antibiotic chromoprotein [Nonomuraea sp. ATR24]|uniref:enediyne antibiotic chromoprotein n=1 Tax=Nonomuraea TaxID=83681 RepID=UPI001C5D088A|nr:enediyne antibiotic chromoprotein [Nonomuraea ceibae]